MVFGDNTVWCWYSGFYAARTQHRSGNTLHPALFKFNETRCKEPTLAGPVGFGGAIDISGKSHDYLCYILTLSSARFRVLTVSGVPVRSLLRVVGGAAMHDNSG